MCLVGCHQRFSPWLSMTVSRTYFNQEQIR